MNYAEEMKEAIKEEIIRVYGKIDEMGCYSGIGGAWLSTEDMFKLICGVIDDYDYMFLDDED